MQSLYRPCGVLCVAGKGMGKPSLSLRDPWGLVRQGYYAGRVMVKAKPQAGQRAWRTRVPREAERTFFFYATVVMFLVYVFFRLFGG